MVNLTNAGTGKNGDTYINTTTGDVFHKANNTWMKTGNLKGAKGDTGTAGKNGTNGTNGVVGSSALSGTTNPAATTGKNGDTYINTTTGDVFHKANNTWIKTGNLKGAKGDTSAVGKNGANGKDGKSILTGTTAPSNANGNSGDVYINSSTGDLYNKDGNQWKFIGNVKGAKGDTGVAGKDGATGKNGANGKDGSSLTTSGTDPVATSGKNGDTHINTLTGDLFTKINNTWIKTGSVKGPKGDKGDTGATGGGSGSGQAGKDSKSITISSILTDAQGNTIVTFSDGTSITILRGDKGEKGDTGVAGKDGATGAKCDKGDTVETGPQGPKGGPGHNGDGHNGGGNSNLNPGDLTPLNNGKGGGNLSGLSTTDKATSGSKSAGKQLPQTGEESLAFLPAAAWTVLGAGVLAYAVSQRKED